MRAYRLAVGPHKALTQPAASLLASARLVPRSITSLRPSLPLSASGAPSLFYRDFSATASPRAADDATGQPRKTVLYDFHLKHGGKVVPFGGYSMPLSYSSLGQVASHHHTRTSASLFDVSHMVQHHFEGLGAGDFLEWLTPTSVKKFGDHQGSLSLLLNFGGGILDDLIITKINDAKYYVVTNAGRRSEDLAWIAERLAEWREQGKGEVKHTVLEDQGLIALQGPKAAEALAKHTDADLSKLTFGKSIYATVAGAPDCHIVRGGYTGEDGFEISVSPEQTEKVSEALLAEEAVELAGLAARDSLRLEAGMCLYGNDLDETVGPAEGGLTWVVAKDRREKGDFIGSERVLKEIKEGPTRRRVGIMVEGAPARGGALLYTPDQPEYIGMITSGIPSPTLGKNIAMAYVKSGYHKRGTKLEVEVRGKRREATLEKMPFVENKFFRG